MTLPKDVDRETRRFYRREQQRLQSCGPDEPCCLSPENVRDTLNLLRADTKLEIQKSLEKIATAAMRYRDAINRHQNENALTDYWAGVRELYLFTAAIAEEVNALENDRDEFLAAASDCTARIKKHERYRKANYPIDLDD